jgi:hypothetical protein
MPAVFDQYGIHFQYPENWTLEADEQTPAQQSVSVYSPGGAFWSVVSHRRRDDPKELAETALGVMQREYQDLDTEEVHEQVEGVEMVGYDLNFFCLDLTNTALVRAFRTHASSYLVICQAEDREFERLGDVFRAITASLLRSQQQTRTQRS